MRLIGAARTAKPWSLYCCGRRAIASDSKIQDAATPGDLPTRETLGDWGPELIHAARSAAQADVYVLRRGGRELILKDCIRRWGPFRRPWGTSILAKEGRILERLAGRDGRLEGPGPVARARAEDLPAEARLESRFAPERADLVLDGRALCP